MDFSTLKKIDDDYVYNPFAGENGGGTSIDFLNTNFGQYTTAEEMKGATTSEGLKQFFDWLADEGKIPRS